MADTRKKTASHDSDAWETGALGQSEKHVRVATDAEMREVDDALELPKTTLRQRTGFLAGEMSVPEDFDTMGADAIAARFGGDT